MTTPQPAAGFFTHRRRWLVVGLLFCFSVASNFDRQTLSVLAPTLKATLGFGAVEYSYVVTSFLVAYTIGYMFAGRLLDRFGVRLCLAAALGFWTVVSMAHAAAAGWMSLVGLRFLLGLGESFNTPGGIKAISEWVPSRERGLSVAILNNGYVWGAILAAPIVLDSALFLDLAKRAGMSGIQEWLSFYFKAPMHAKEVYPEHDLFIQLMKLKNTLRYLKGEELITHLGLEYYD